ncbi:MAG TPA: hypothetical protein DEP59_02900 [Moraxella sp.]|nr:hypothetical protein [Moraxella sp.]
MPNLASSPHHALLLLKGLALTGFLVLTYLAFHQPMFYQPTAVLAANATIVTSDTMVSHHPLSHPNSHQSHQADGVHKTQSLEDLLKVLLKARYPLSKILA